MKKRWVITPLVIAVPLVLALLWTFTQPAASAPGDPNFRARLEGFQETPAVSTTGSGEFRARISSDETSISYTLSYSNLEAKASAAHIHLGQRGVAGGVIAFLCGGGNKPACPETSGTVTGTITAADVIGPAGQGIAAGELQEALRAMRRGVTYANVHSDKFPSGEIRGQLSDRDGGLLGLDERLRVRVDEMLDEILGGLF